jgi:hypothetical protein
MLTPAPIAIRTPPQITTASPVTIANIPTATVPSPPATIGIAAQQPVPIVLPMPDVVFAPVTTAPPQQQQQPTSPQLQLHVNNLVYISKNVVRGARSFYEDEPEK